MLPAARDAGMGDSPHSGRLFVFAACPNTRSCLRSCPGSARLASVRGFLEGRISGSSQPFRSPDETEIRATHVSMPVLTGDDGEAATVAVAAQCPAPGSHASRCRGSRMPLSGNHSAGLPRENSRQFDNLRARTPTLRTRRGGHWIPRALIAGSNTSSARDFQSSLDKFD